MVTKNEQFQKVWRDYDVRQDHQPTSTREACEWAVAAGLLELPVIDQYDVLADQMSRALREEYKTDAIGRRYRVNHAVRASKHGVQMTFGGRMDGALRDHMTKAFTQRRENIIGDCRQLKVDVDVYNDMNKDQPPIQLVLDFTDDVAEREFWAEEKREAA